MKYFKHVLFLAGILLCWSGAFADTGFQNSGDGLRNPITIGLPKIAVTENDSLDLSVMISGNSGQQIYSVYLKIEIDTTVVEVLDVRKGSVTNTWQNPTWNVHEGKLLISLYGTAPFSANGEVLIISIRAIGTEGQASQLNFNLAALNEGNPACQTENGIVFIGTPYPVFEQIANLEYLESDLVEVEISAHDPLGRDMVLSSSNLPTRSSFQDLGGGNGLFTWETDHFSAGTYNPIFTVVNADLLSAQLSFELQIINEPQAPYIYQAFPAVSFNEDIVHQAFSLSAHVRDGDLDQGDVLAIALENNSKVFAQLENGFVKFWATANWHGTETVTIKISDSYGMFTTQAIVVTVISVNDSPALISPLPEVNILEDHQGYSIDLSEYFRDVDNAFVYSVSGAANIDYTFENNELTIVPQPDWHGTETVMVTATEGALIAPRSTDKDRLDIRNLSIFSSLVVNVSPVNDSPIILQQLPQVEMGSNQSYQLQDLDSYFGDVDSQLVYTFSGNPNISIQVIDNVLHITPNQDWIGVQRISIRATDDFEEYVAQDLVVIVRASYSYIEDFDNGGLLPTGWTKSGSFWQTYLESGSDYAMRVANPQLSSTQRLQSPSINLASIINPVVSFWYNLQCPTGVTASLQYSLNGISYYNLASFNQSTAAWFSIPAPQIENKSGVRIRWHYTSSTALPNYWIIDNFSISGVVGDFAVPVAVTDFRVSNASQNSLSLSWTPVSGSYFDRYEISVMADSLLSTELFVWSATNDANLNLKTTSTTTIGGLQHLSRYYLAIRSVNIGNNSSAWSQIIPGVASTPPLINVITPVGNWYNDREIILHCEIGDDALINANSISYRIDLNNNGNYDATEVWNQVNGYSNAASLNIAIPVTYPQDGSGIHFEVRCTDLQNNLLSYSGVSHLEGVSDDYHINIDTVIPETIEGFNTIAHSGSSVQLNWQVSDDEHFSHYEIFYGIHPSIDLEDNLYSIIQNPALTEITCNSVTITGLQPSVRYWFRIAAVDLAGNKGELSNTVTNVLNSITPRIYAPIPVQIYGQRYYNQLVTNIGCKISDAYGIDLESIQYRYDANGNRSYDAPEVWQSVYPGNLRYLSSNTRDNPVINESGDFEILVNVPATFEVDADTLRFEFRAKDIDGYGYSYSGTNSLNGIGDDWFLGIDTTLPEEIQALTMGVAGFTSAEVFWTSSSDLHFTGYKVLYGTSAGISIESSSYSFEVYSELVSPGSGTKSFMMQGLQASTQYYVRIAAFDIAGNYSISEEISFMTSSDTIPATPQNLTLTISGFDVLLSWDPVSHDVNGNPISINQYSIYLSETPDFPIDESTYFETVDTTSYLFEGVAEYVNRLFFRVIAAD